MGGEPKTHGQPERGTPVQPAALGLGPHTGLGDGLPWARREEKGSYSLGRRSPHSLNKGSAPPHTHPKGSATPTQVFNHCSHHRKYFCMMPR